MKLRKSSKKELKNKNPQDFHSEGLTLTNHHLFYYFEVIRYSFIWLNNTILKVLFIYRSSNCSSKFKTKKNPKSITTVGVFKFRRYEKGITFPYRPYRPYRPYHPCHQAFQQEPNLYLLAYQLSLLQWLLIIQR